MALRLLENTFVSKKTESVRFYSLKTLSQILMMTPQVEENYLFPQTLALKIYFYPLQKREREGRDYGVGKMTKDELSRVLITSFDKFPHLCNLYIFYSCSAVS